MPKLIQWPKEIKFSRPVLDEEGNQVKENGKGVTESSKVTVEVPQIDAELPLNEFAEDAAKHAGGEKKFKDYYNTCLALDAIRDGQQSVTYSSKKDNAPEYGEAVKDALEIIAAFIPGVSQQGAAAREAFASKRTVDGLKEALQRMKAGEISEEDYEALLLEAGLL